MLLPLQIINLVVVGSENRVGPQRCHDAIVCRNSAVCHDLCMQTGTLMFPTVCMNYCWSIMIPTSRHAVLASDMLSTEYLPIFTSCWHAVLAANMLY